MTDFWPGQDPWNAFEHRPAWDGAGEPESERDPNPRTAEPHASAEPAHEVAFVQQAIQRVYHP